MYFVSGIHGVGKTTYCEKLCKELKVPYFTASEIIKNIDRNKIDCSKRVSNVSENQGILEIGINELKKTCPDFILDGHLCLINKSGEIEQIQPEVFKKIGIEKMIILIDKPKRIKERLKKRDNVDWDITFIKQFQNAEIEYGKKIAEMLNIGLDIMENDVKAEKNNIILPIAPKYAQSILDGKKRYEYRKKLCSKNIDTIYLYATAPVKSIIGEVKVKNKVVMDKEQLWKISRLESGITYDFFCEYFRNTLTGSAYQLGEYKRYKRGIPLPEIGIDYTIQSFVYTDKLHLD